MSDIKHAIEALSRYFESVGLSKDVADKLAARHVGRAVDEIGPLMARIAV